MRRVNVVVYPNLFFTLAIFFYALPLFLFLLRVVLLRGQ
jgi:hypothetical protein